MAAKIMFLESNNRMEMEENNRTMPGDATTRNQRWRRFIESIYPTSFWDLFLARRAGYPSTFPAVSGFCRSR